jgi:DNA-binding PucR family transcriptional regulator
MMRVAAELPWYHHLGPSDQAHLTVVVDNAVSHFTAWFQHPDTGSPSGISEILSAAPRELATVITLRQTLQLVRLMVDVVETQATTLAPPGQERDLRDALLRYSRDVAFSAAEAYAKAAEQRGAWDARLEAQAIDALVRGDAEDEVRSRLSALGWSGRGQAVVLVGKIRDDFSEDSEALIRRTARSVAADALVGIHENRVLIVLAGEGDLLAAAEHLAPLLADGHVITGGVVDSVTDASRSAQAALAGLTAVSAWPGATPVVAAEDLLPERVLTGDATARAGLVDRVYRPVAEAGADILPTLMAYQESGNSLEGTARALFVHPNTVRNRLKKVTDLTAWDPHEPRDAFVLHVAVALGLLEAAAG